MADTDKLYISKITLPSNSTYYLKDEEARSQIAALSGGDAIIFVGVSSVKLTDGGNEIPQVDGETKTPATGQLFFYGTQEFIYGADSKWHELGSLNALGSLAYKNEATGSFKPAGTVTKPIFTGSESTVTITSTANSSGNYQPQGTISEPSFTGSNSTFSGTFQPAGSVTVTTKSTSNKTAAVNTATVSTSAPATYTPSGKVTAPTITLATAGSTATIKNPTSKTMVASVVTAAPGATAPANNITYYSVAGETLSLYKLGYTTGASITTTDVAVKTDDASYTASAPNFTGDGVRLVTGNIPVPSEYTAKFNGTSATVTTSGTPLGKVGVPTFTGTKVQLAGTTTAAGEVSQPTFNGTQDTITVS